MDTGIILDFDGTIIDSETNMFNVINEHLTSGGFEPFDVEFYKASIGTDSPEMEAAILEKIGEEGLRAIDEEHRRTCLDLECNAHILKIIDFCSANKIPMAVATSSRREDIIPMLKNLGIYEHFVSVRGKEDVEKVKPDPALYEMAAEDLGLDPSDVFAIEDTVNGARAAEAAGVNVIVRTNDMTADMDFSGVGFYSKDADYEEIIEELESRLK